MAEPGNGWELHRIEQLRRWRELSPQQRLDWLWQAKQFAAKAAEACAERRRPLGPTTGTGKDTRE
jgi:hypothetical protein